MGPAEWLRSLVGLVAALAWPIGMLVVVMMFRHELRVFLTERAIGPAGVSVDRPGLVQVFPSPRETEITTEITMGDKIGRDKFETGQAGAVGPGAHAHDMPLQQVWNQFKGSTNLSTLAEELATLRSALRTRSSTADQDIAVGVIAEAERAAKQGDGQTAIASLASAGKWALQVAQEIGTNLAAEVLKKSLGLGP